MKRLLTLSGMALMALALSCTKVDSPDAAKVKMDFEKALESSWQYGHDQKDILEHNLEGYVQQLEAEYNTLKSKMDEKKDVSREQVKLMTQEVQGKIDKVREQVMIIDAAGEDSWDSVKKRAQNAVTEVQAGFKRAWDSLKTGEVPNS